VSLANLLSGVFVALLGVCALVSAKPLPYQAEYGPGPGFLPFWIGLGLAACGVMIAAASLRRLGAGSERFFGPGTRKVAFVFASLVVTFLLTPALGLTAALSLFSGLAAGASGRHHWALCLLLAVATGVTIRLVFGYVLDVPLPRGLTGV
jgi:hypothetical protein